MPSDSLLYNVEIAEENWIVFKMKTVLDPVFWSLILALPDYREKEPEASTSVFTLSP
jgi:hypothetical protein